MQSGFLDAAPEEWGGVTRRKFWMREGIDLNLPKLGRVAYFLEFLGPSGVGWFQNSGLGIEPLSWSEILNFSQATGTKLEPWEAEQIRACSVAYVSGYRRGQRPMAVSPAFEDHPEDDPGVQIERKKVADQVRAAFSQKPQPDE